MTVTPRPAHGILRTRGRVAKAWAYRETPGLLLRKALQVWRGWRRKPRYRALLTQGRFLPTIQAPPGDRLFTVALPVWRVAEEHLRAAIASVAAQSYGNWELIALDDASPDPHIGRLLAEASRSDPRIRVLTRRSNAGIGAASNEILRQARGEYLAFLDHDDLLHPQALELVGRFLSLRPDTDWVFTDEDKVDEGGRHLEPCLKPGWSRHLLLTFNYVSHLRVVRRTMLEAVGGHRPAFDGAQDYDLALRILASGGRFAHLPGILYHWRTVRASMAIAANAKPAAHERALQALSEHAATFPQGGVPSARVLLPAASFFEVRRPCRKDVGIAVVDCFGNAKVWVRLLGRPVEVVGAEENLYPEALVALARRATAQFLVVAPKGGLGAHALEELLALLQVPGTAVAAGRWLKGNRVESSGWVATDRAELWDPWRRLAKRNPAYLNLALVPGPRLVPPPTGFAVNRDALLEAWEAASDVAPAWRLPTGWARLRLEVVVAPQVELRKGGPFAAPPVPPPPELPSIRLSWLAELGLVEATSR